MSEDLTGDPTLCELQELATLSLLNQSRFGDRRARNVLLERHRPALMRWVHGRLPIRSGDDQDTEAGGHARLDVRDIAGRRVATLADGPRPTGRRVVDWDWRDARGAPVPTGLYLVRLRHEGHSLVIRLAIMR